MKIRISPGGGERRLRGKKDVDLEGTALIEMKGKKTDFSCGKKGGNAHGRCEKGRNLGLWGGKT